MTMTKRLQTRIPEELYLELLGEALATGLKISQVVRLRLSKRIIMKAEEVLECVK